MPTTIKSLIIQATQTLQAAEVTDTARLDVEILLADVLDKPRSYFFSWPEAELTNEQESTFNTLLSRRVQGEPIAYITGMQEFWSLPFSVNKHTLIPRPETELLVETALDLCTTPETASVIDLGTGSGCIAISLAHERPSWHVSAVDQSSGALDTAKHNASCNEVSINFIQSSWFNDVSGTFDLIVSNPPYIHPQDHHLDEGDVRFEPRTALAANEGGKADLTHIIESATQYLNPNGHLLLEFGYDQGEWVAQKLIATGYEDVTVYKDLNNIIRAASGRQPVT